MERQIEITYADLKQQEDPVEDLVEAYATLSAMAATFSSASVLKIAASRVLLNPAYHTKPEKFPFIRKDLDSLLGKDNVEDFLKQIKDKG